jgi:hypothetical protein
MGFEDGILRSRKARLVYLQVVSPFTPPDLTATINEVSKS